MDKRRKHDWQAIQMHHDEGHGLRACMKEFHFSFDAWYKAVDRGELVPRPMGTPLEVMLKRGHRGSIKARLIRDKILSEVCDICGMGPTWLDQPLVLRLDHINGINNDYRIENLRLLCPNCDSQTEFYCGRNNQQAPVAKRQRS